MFAKERIQWFVSVKLSFSYSKPQVKFTQGFKCFATYYKLREGDCIRFTLVAPCLFKVHIPGREKSPPRHLLEPPNFNEVVVVDLDAIDKP